VQEAELAFWRKSVSFETGRGRAGRLGTRVKIGNILTSWCSCSEFLNWRKSSNDIFRRTG